MKKRFSFLFLIPFLAYATIGSAAQPSSPALNSTVKVTSGICGQDGSKFRGSGVLLRDARKTYVLTSDHILINSNSGVCHRVSNSKIGSVKTKVLVSDWASGIALLEVLGSVSPDVALPLSVIAKRPPAEREKLTVSGFPFEPFDAKEPTLYSEGSVLKAQSTRHVFAHAVPMIELFDTHAEFGMSGGPVFSTDESQILGMISHQAIELVAGGPSRVVEISGKKSGEKTHVYNHIFVISPDFISSWLEGYFSDPETFKPALVESPKNQLLGKKSVITDGLEFITVSAKDAGVGGIGGGDATGTKGIGGGDATGTKGIGGSKGGGDPTGVGGNVLNAPVEPDDAVIVVTLAETNLPASLGRLDRAKWISGMREALLLQKKIVIPYLYRRDPDTQAPVKIKIESLSQFFREIANSGVEPVTRTLSVDGQESVQTSFESPFSSGSFRTVMDDLLKNLKILKQGAGSVEEKVLLSRAIFTVEVLQSATWETIRPAELKDMIEKKGVFEAAWSQLFVRDFDHSVEFLKGLGLVEEELKKRVR